jgi:hypothetical protein
LTSIKESQWQIPIEISALLSFHSQTLRLARLYPAFDRPAMLRHQVGIAAASSPVEAAKSRSRVAFSIYVHKNEFSFLNFILVVTAKQASISQSAMPTLGFQSNGRRSRPKEYPHVT